jgi:hypothetical protein
VTALDKRVLKLGVRLANANRKDIDSSKFCVQPKRIEIVNVP